MGTHLPSDLNDRVSGLWYGLAIVMFTPSFTALVVWDKERLLLRRESATGTHGFAASQAASLPLRCVMAASRATETVVWTDISGLRQLML